MGALQSIPFCSREKQQKGDEVPPLQLDNNNNEAVVDQPPAAAATTAEPVATSTPRQRAGSGGGGSESSSLAEELTVDDGLELSSGFENPHFGPQCGASEDGEQPAAHVNQAVDVEDDDDIGPVVDQVIGGSSSDEEEGNDSGLALQEFRKRHNLDPDQLRREAMTPPPDLEDDFADDQFEDILDDDDEEDETLNVDSRDLSSSEDPVERPPEPRVPEEKRLSPSSSSDGGDEPSQYYAKHDPTVEAISTMLSDIVGADRPHPDMSTHVVSRQ